MSTERLGIVGEIVDAIQPYTEADTGALVVDLLASSGSCIGRKPHGIAGNRRHGLKLNAVLVGDTSTGGKGSSRAISERIWEYVDPEWAEEHVGTGLSSGEGLVQALHDLDGSRVFMAVEEEFGRILTISMRRGETISEVLRQLWDKDDAVTLNRQKTVVDGAHFNFIGHITRDELLDKIRETDIRNGFVNRNLWVYTHIARLIPDARVPDVLLVDLGNRLRKRIHAARKLSEIRRDQGGERRWEEWYVRSRTQRLNGTLGYVLGRREAQMFRLQLVFAALDGSNQVTAQHVEQAERVWNYCQRSCAYIFGDKTGNPRSDQVLAALSAAKSGTLSRSEISVRLFSKNIAKKELDAIRDQLKRLGRIQIQYPMSGRRGRPVERWKLIG